MFKHKIIKYFLISALILFFLIFIAIFRLSYKPLDITYFSNTYPLVQKQVSELFDIKSKKVFLKLDVLKNELSLKAYNVLLQDFNYKISNVKAKQALITFKITDIIKNKIETNNITIKQGGLDIYDLKEFVKTNQLDNAKKTYAFNNIVFEEININIYEGNKKIALLSDCNLALSKNEDGLHINDLLIDSLVLKNANTKDNLILNNLKLIQKNKPNYTFKIENIELQNRETYFKNKYIKNLNKVLFKEVIFNYNSISFYTSIEGKVLLNNYTNSFFANGTIMNFKEFKGDLTVNIDKFPIFTLIENNIFLENKYNVNNISSIYFSGMLTASIKKNIFEKVGIKIFSKLNDSDIFLKNLKNSTKIKIEDIALEGQFNKNIYEIKTLNINQDKQNLKINGKFYNNFKNFFLDINAEKIKFNKVNKFLNNSLDANLKYLDGISSINVEKIKNLKLNILKDNNNTNFNILNSDLENIKLVTRKKMKLDISSAKIIKKNNSIKLYSSDLKVQGVLGSSYISSLSIFSDDYRKINSNIEVKSYISTNYKFLNFLLSEFNINKNFPRNLEGEVSGFLKISNKKNYGSYRYFFEGSLDNFNYIKINNDNMPIVLSKFNGEVVLSNDLIKIDGKGAINGSQSDIKILVNKDSVLTATIDAQAKPSSFNFLGKYNFIQEGNSKLKISITKNMNTRKWKASFNANLFSNEINVNFINFFKPINRRGTISGELYFEDLDLIKVDKLDFLTEELLVSANLIFKGDGELESIYINRFIKDRNNFKAQMQFIEGKYNFLKIEGESLDFKSLKSYGDRDFNATNLYLNIDNFYYDSIYFGHTFIESEIKNNKLIKFKGNISDNKSIYIRFANTMDKQSELNRINIEFDDFGKFLNKSSISDSFIKGEGTATLYFKELNLLSGNLEVTDSSIKNSSFLARLLQLASFTGLLEILTNEGIPFDRIIVNFTNKNNIIKIEEAKFQGFSLGGNLKGVTELDKEKINLEGIIVPAYAINALLNKIPLIGQVITGIEGDGLIGVNFKVTGTYDEPNYNVNPLSILTPGIVRSIFESFFEGNNEDKITE